MVLDSFVIFCLALSKEGRCLLAHHLLGHLALLQIIIIVYSNTAPIILAPTLTQPPIPIPISTPTINHFLERLILKPQILQLPIYLISLMDNIIKLTAYLLGITL